MPLRINTSFSVGNTVNTLVGVFDKCLRYCFEHLFTVVAMLNVTTNSHILVYACSITPDEKNRWLNQ